jgi:hypothetical protein
MPAAVNPQSRRRELFSKEPFSGTLDVIIRNLSNEIVEEKKIDITLSRESTEIPVCLDIQREGFYRFDCILRREGKSCDFVSSAFEVKNQIG